ncbi:MAG: DUF6653 family protein [Paracoccaceae bacterium]
MRAAPRGGFWARAAALHRLDDEGWARHANPWSGWSRIVTGLPLLVLALWSRAWIGWWSLAAIALALAWVILNPRAFPPARSDGTWAAKGVFGERIWIERPDAVPARHRRVPKVLTALSAAGLPFLAYGLAVLDPWPTALGAALAMIFKLWFVDRCALLYDEAVAVDPRLRYRAPDHDRERTP